MWWAEISIWLGGALVGVLSFLLGKAYNQSERVIEEKRRVYEKFLSVCPAPNEAHNELDLSSLEMQRYIGVVTIYGSTDVVNYAGIK